MFILVVSVLANKKLLDVDALVDPAGVVCAFDSGFWIGFYVRMLLKLTMQKWTRFYHRVHWLSNTVVLTVTSKGLVFIISQCFG